MQKSHSVKQLDFTSQRYMDAHLNFRQNLTNQGRLMQEYLRDKISSYITSNNLEHIGIASIGSGTGIIDAPLIGDLQNLCPVNFLGIEPNKFENKMASDKFQNILNANSQAHFFEGLMEDIDPSKYNKFDVITGVHVTYYSSDITHMIKKAFELLNPDNGLFIILVSANTPQNELFKETTKAIHNYTPFMANEYKAILDSLGVSYTSESINAKVDVTDFLNDPYSKSSTQFLDFFLHADSASIESEDIERYINVIRSHAIVGERSFLPHIVEAITVTT